MTAITDNQLTKIQNSPVPLIEMRGVNKSFGQKVILDRVNLKIDMNQLLV